MLKRQGKTQGRLWFLAFLAVFAHGQGFELGRAGRMVMTGFKSRGCREDGTPHWELSGAKAVLVGATAEVEKACVRFYLESGECTVITSPKCRFNQTTKVGLSDAPIHARSRTMTMDGVGYEIFVKEQRLHIRNKVRMTIRHSAQLRERTRLLPGNKPPPDGR